MALEVLIDACPLYHVPAADSSKVNKRSSSGPRPWTIPTHIEDSFVVVVGRMVVVAAPRPQSCAPTTVRHGTRQKNSNVQASAQG